MIVDARLPNRMHHSPPVTRLASSACYRDLDLSSEGACFPLGHSSADNGTGCAQEADVSDCFYNYSIEELAEWFGVDEPLSAEEWRSFVAEVKHEFDPELGKHVPVESSDVLYPCIVGLSMGWAWAVYFANEVVAYDVQMAGGTPGDDVRERQPFPQLSAYPTVTGTYVDNVSIISFLASLVTARAKLIDEKFKSAGIPLVTARAKLIDEKCKSVGIPLVWTQPETVKKLEIVGAFL